MRSLLFGGAGSGLLSKVAAAEDTVSSPPAATHAPGSCILLPQAVEGPYYFDPKAVRSDITEGRPGLPLRLALQVIEHGSCQPLAKARVDVWHADARGVYSGYPGQGDDRNISAKGETYLRGTQFTDADGKVLFKSIYPGWYPGRTPHIHVKAFLDEKTLVTAQVYFPDALSARIYRETKPYDNRPRADTDNASDFIFQAGQKDGGGIVLAIEEQPGTLTASLVMAVDRSGPAAKRWSIWDLVR
jgi:protocatechuate 3,4-dioxygenase beta subunit